MRSLESIAPVGNVPTFATRNVCRESLAYGLALFPIGVQDDAVANVAGPQSLERFIDA